MQITSSKKKQAKQSWCIPFSIFYQWHCQVFQNYWMPKVLLLLVSFISIEDSTDLQCASLLTLHTLCNYFKFTDTVTRRSLPLIFTPLGGLFSMFTFVWGKVHGIRLLNPNMSRTDAFKSLFANTGVSDESVFFSNLELIDNQAQEVILVLEFQ